MKLITIVHTILLASGIVASNSPVLREDCVDASAPLGCSDLERREVGARNIADWRVWLLRDGHPVSFWHDVPLFSDEKDHRVVNMVVEIPRWTNGKIEINREEPLNPIFHDEEEDKPRFVESVWPHKSYPFTYGSVPQTWESPNFVHEFTELPGDNDPVDIIDIGDDVGYVGEIKQVKVLGGLALADGDETDWKILSVDVKDPLAALVDSEDLEKHRPGLTKTYREWFTYYKVARGDDLIPIIGDDYQDADFIVKVLEESHGFWEGLVEGSVDSNEINYNETSQDFFDSFVSRCEATEAFDIPGEDKNKPAAEVPGKYTRWYYHDENFELIAIPEGS